MSKEKKPPAPDCGYVAITWDILNSEAFKELRHSAGKLLPYFLGKPKKPTWYDEAYKWPFEFSYTEARSYGFANTTFSNALDQLIGNGFVDPVEKGGIRSEGMAGSKYRLSKRWKHFGKRGFIKMDKRTLAP